MSEVVPEGWHIHRLREICDGISVGHVGSTAEHYTDHSGIKFIRTGDLKNGKMAVLSGSGLGFEINHENVNKAHELYLASIL